MGHLLHNEQPADQTASEVAALLLETLRLSHVDSSGLAERWIHADTRGLISLLRREGGELWLHRRLCQLDLADTALGKTSFWFQLERLARRTVAQNLLVQSHADVVIQLLEREGVSVIPIKGIARIDLARQFPFADCRATNDVDLLVPMLQRDDAWSILSRHGYRQASDRTPPGHYHLPPLADAAQIPVEVHTSTSTQVTPNEAWRRAQSAGNTTELLWQGWMHGMDQGLEAFFLRYFLDAAVALGNSHSVDWTTITHRLRSKETDDRKLAVTWLRAASYFGDESLPAHVSELSAPFALHRMYTWRIRIFRSRVRNRAWTRKLLAEALRSEFRMKTERPVPATPVSHKTRRWISAAAARLMYRTWKRLHPSNETV